MLSAAALRAAAKRAEIYPKNRSGYWGKSAKNRWVKNPDKVGEFG